MRTLLRTVPAVLLTVLALAAGTSAQTTTGGLTGVIRDSDGGVVPGATVRATSTATGATSDTISLDSGQYVLRGLPVGTYVVEVELSGFQTVRAEDVTVRVNEEVRLDATLRVGDLTETVTVSGMASTVDTTSSTLKTVVDQKRIEELPLNGRNPTQLLQLVAGVQTDTRTSLTSGSTYPGVQPVSSGGARANTTNYVLDGGSNNDHYSNAPNPMPAPIAPSTSSATNDSAHTVSPCIAPAPAVCQRWAMPATSPPMKRAMSPAPSDHHHSDASMAVPCPARMALRPTATRTSGSSGRS